MSHVWLKCEWIKARQPEGKGEKSSEVINRIQGKSMLENKKLSDREILYQFLRRIPIENRTIAYDIVDRDSNEKQDRKQVTTS